MEKNIIKLEDGVDLIMPASKNLPKKYSEISDECFSGLNEIASCMETELKEILLGNEEIMKILPADQELVFELRWQIEIIPRMSIRLQKRQ